MSAVLSDLGFQDVERRTGTDEPVARSRPLRVLHDVVVDRGLQLAGFAVIVLAAVLSLTAG